MSDAPIGHGRVHVVGIGGAGMSAIATVLVAMGEQVSGSDLRESTTLARLRALGIEVAIGHAAENVAGAGLVTISSAVGPDNPEVLAARAAGIPVWSRAAMLVEIARRRRTVAVAGTHGKTTTSSMLALILVEAGMHPSFLIGGDVNEIGTNATWGSGDLLVVEADESDGTFLELDPELAVITNVEADHLDHFGSLAGLQSAFADFARRARFTIVCADDPGARAIAPAGARTYGTSADAEVRIVKLRTGRSEVHFGLESDGTLLAEVHLPIPGVHNARNAAGALLAAVALGAPVSAAERALARFGGVARRFEFRGEAGGVVFVDDYAHLPGEVAATLAAARAGGFARVVAVFQPHRYSRTGQLAAAFADSFLDADLVVVTAIYAAGETPRPGVSAKLVLDAVLQAHPRTAAAYFPERGDLVAYLRGVLRPGDVCLTMSAGDLTSLPDELIESLR